MLTRNQRYFCVVACLIFALPALANEPGGKSQKRAVLSPGREEETTKDKREISETKRKEGLKSDTGRLKKPASKSITKIPKVVKPDRYWRSRLSTIQYYVARRKATEQAFSGAFWNHHADGVYVCVCCGTSLFDSEAKFDSGTGWPSFWQTVSGKLIQTKPDFSNGTLRVEVNCRVCDAHLGHVFNDGPRPTGLRFCINSASIDFVERKSLQEHVEKWRDSVGLPPLETKKTEKDLKEGEASESYVEKSQDLEKNPIKD